MFSSQIPWPIESCSELKSLCFYYSRLSSGFHLLFTAVSQCFSKETWIFSQCVRAHGNGWMLVCSIYKIGNACGLQCVCVRVCVCGRESKREGLCETGDFQTHLWLYCMCVCVCALKAGGWVNYLKMLKKEQKQSKHSFPPFPAPTPNPKYSECHEIRPHRLQKV